MSKDIMELLPSKTCQFDFTVEITGFDNNALFPHVVIQDSIDEKNLEWYSATGIHCDPYYFDLNELLNPIKYTTAEYLDQWNRYFPC